jgi:enoyl-CoA hydratase/carnithine racemase
LPATGEAPLVKLQPRGEVTVVRLQRPKVNALSAQLLAQLAGTLRALAASAPRALILWGGERSFSAGVDVGELADDATAPVVLDCFADALGALSGFPSATVAAINGFALGGGLELALACDFRVVGEDARLGLPEVGLGLIPGGGGTQRLPRLIGPARAKELVLSGRNVTASEAVAMGLADREVAADDVLAGALEFASQFAHGSPGAQAAAKRAVDMGMEVTLAEGLALERRLFDEVRRSEAGRAGLRGFLERRGKRP